MRLPCARQPYQPFSYCEELDCCLVRFGSVHRWRNAGEWLPTAGCVHTESLDLLLSVGVGVHWQAGPREAELLPLARSLSSGSLARSITFHSYRHRDNRAALAVRRRASRAGETIAVYCCPSLDADADELRYGGGGANSSRALCCEAPGQCVVTCWSVWVGASDDVSRARSCVAFAGFALLASKQPRPRDGTALLIVPLGQREHCGNEAGKQSNLPVIPFTTTESDCARCHCLAQGRRLTQTRWCARCVRFSRVIPAVV